MREIQFLIEDEYEEYVGIRLDRSISEIMDEISRSFIQKILKEGNIRVNDKLEKASYLLKYGDKISMNIPDSQPTDIQEENIPLSILYEDPDVLVVDKPKGMVVHPAAGHLSGTLVNAVLFHCKDQLSGINGVMRPGIVHRIDMDTTGSIIVCKNDQAHIKVSEQLKEHSLKRTYRAIVHGIIKEEEGTIDAPIGRSEKDRKKMTVREDGKRAVTHFKVLERFQKFTYIECNLETGRTHQIRVHFNYIGHPILGDSVYSGLKHPFHLQGQTLHAYDLGFIHPSTGELVHVCAPLPLYFEELIQKLRAAT